MFLIALTLLTGSILDRPQGVARASGLDLDTEIAAKFPDRKTSSYDSQQLVSFLRGQLEGRGWKTETQAYSLLLRSDAPKALDTAFVQVSGENVLAYRTPPSAANPVDLLLVAPYDVLVKEPSEPNGISYTARATAVLLSLASGLDPSKSWPAFPSVAVAFVSGHYQYGAGIGALVEELTVKRGAQVKAALVVGDIDAMDSIPVTVDDRTPAGLAQAVYRSARKSGARVTLVGPGAREAWSRAVMRPQAGALSVESMFDNGTFQGEAAVLLEKGIPALTLGTPRNNLQLRLSPPSPGKIDRVTATLRGFLDSSPAQGTGQTRAGDTVSVQVFGKLLFIPRATASVFGVAGAMAAATVLALGLGRRKDLTPLALLAGVLAAAGVAHFLTNLWVGSNSRIYTAAVSPSEVLFLYFWSGLTLVALGFFRIWRIRTRIAQLHSRLPVPSSMDGADEHVSSPAQSTWAGPWGLAAVTAVLAGTSLLGSEVFAPALLATVCLSVAVLLDHPGLGKAATWAVRLLGTLPVLLTIFWAGSPFSGDAARIYSVTTAGMNVESVSFTISVAVFATLLVSSFRFPAPASPKSVKFMTLAELATVLVLVALGLTIPKIGAAALPARALIREYYGTESKITVETSRPLGLVTLVPQGAQLVVSGLPSGLSNRSISESIRMGNYEVPSTWATVWQGAKNSVKHQDGKATVTGEISATFFERPSYYQVRFQDAAYTRNVTIPFQLINLPSVLGTAGRTPGPEATVTPVPGYSITVTWWMPQESSLTREFVVTFQPASSRVDVTGRAVYLDRSYAGFKPSAPNARFVSVTTVANQSGYR